MILAPHPDDESLATGGLIQQAIRRGAHIRVVFVSDGENNPWPQRFVERRWRIGPRDQARWACRRRQEALAALRCLGLSENNVRFLGLPDQGLTTALLHAQEGPIGALTEALTAWPPDLLVAPSPHDGHPDHNALAILVNFALARIGAGSDLRLIHYVVHSRQQRLPAPYWTLSLSPEQRATKRQAILEHKSQMALSRGRFLSYARSVERFYLPGAVDPAQRIRCAGLENGALCVWIQPTHRPGHNGELFVAIESTLHGSIRWRLRVHDRSGVVSIVDAITGRTVRNASVRSTGRSIHLRLPISPALPVERIALKLNCRTTFYDETGWHEVALPANETRSNACRMARPRIASGVAASSEVACRLQIPG